MRSSRLLGVPLLLALMLSACDSARIAEPTWLERAVIDASAQGATAPPELLFPFEEATGQLPEGVAIDKTGNIFVSINPLGEVWMIAPGSAGPKLFGAVAGIDVSRGDVGLLGLAVDARGNVYAGVHSLDPAVNGAWILDRKTGAASRIRGSEAIAFANAFAFDKRGNLYITDSAAGAIWRVPRHGDLEPWLVGDTNLEGTGVLGLGAPVGANGIAYRKGRLYVANSEKTSIVIVPIQRDGSAGPSEILTTFPVVEVAPGVFFPSVPDGLAFDAHGGLYVAQISVSAIVKVAQDGTVSEIASGDPLDWPSSIAFGTTGGYQKTLFAVNFSIGEGNGDTVIRMGPGLVAIEVGVPGMPLP